MSTENIEKFYALAYSQPALVADLRMDSEPAVFAEQAVRLGAANGFAFSAAEAQAWQQAKAEATRNNELDDLQLEAVAGGKGNPGLFFKGLGKVGIGTVGVLLGGTSPGGIAPKIGVEGCKDMVTGMGG
jgi:hypothetical protein